MITNTLFAIALGFLAIGGVLHTTRTWAESTGKERLQNLWRVAVFIGAAALMAQMAWHEYTAR